MDLNCNITGRTEGQRSVRFCKTMQSTCPLMSRVTQSSYSSVFECLLDMFFSVQPPRAGRAQRPLLRQQKAPCHTIDKHAPPQSIGERHERVAFTYCRTNTEVSLKQQESPVSLFSFIPRPTDHRKLKQRTTL